MTRLTVRIGSLSFAAVLETERAPHTASAFLARLPFEGQLVQARWSGEAGWVPLADYDLGVAYENATSHPAPGQVLWHPARAQRGGASGAVWKYALLQPRRPACGQPFSDDP